MTKVCNISSLLLLPPRKGYLHVQSELFVPPVFIVHQEVASGQKLLDSLPDRLVHGLKLVDKLIKKNRIHQIRIDPRM